MAYTQNELPNGLDTKATTVGADIYVVGDSEDVGRVKGQTKTNLLADLTASLTGLFNKSSDDTDDITEGDNKFVTQAQIDAFHPAVTVSDTSEIDLSLSGQEISAAIVAGSIDEAKLDTSVNASLDLADAAVRSLVAGTNMSIDATDPLNPIVATNSNITPLTTKGDVYTYGTDNARLPVGTNGQFLKADSGETTGLAWSTPAGAGDMLKSVYDPNTVEGDAFDMDNMVEGADAKVLTAAERTKLTGVEALADVTDTANVTSAGALMDSEVTNLAQVKAFDTTDYATSAQGTLADSALQSADVGTIATQDANAVNIDGGAIDGTPIGATTPSTGEFSTVETSGNIELGHATDTTLSRSSAGVLAVEGVIIPSVSSTSTLTNKTLTTPAIASVKGTLTTDTDGATITFDKNVSDFHNVVMEGNRTLALSNMAVGDRIVLRLTQDATGTRVPTFFTTIKWAGGTAPTLTTTANKADIFGFLCTSSGNYDGFVIGQNI